MPQEDRHALLGPSAAKRWINCPASAAIARRVPSKASCYADAGTCAHAYAAKGIKERLGWATVEEDAEIARHWDHRSWEMMACANWYASHVWEEYQAEKSQGRAEIFVEEELDLSHWAPESFGTADAIVVSDRKLLVADFKYGKGVMVSAVRNPQLAMYALGAIALLGDAYGFDSVELAICQPRVGEPRLGLKPGDPDIWARKWHAPVADLMGWGENVLKPAAQRAWNAKEGDRRYPGEWCRFCPGLDECRQGQDQKRYKRDDYDDGALSFGDFLGHHMEDTLNELHQCLAEIGRDCNNDNNDKNDKNN